ncbi:LOW QUALITY PROTEIN: zinc finger and BTB domain-containing protein 40-like [Syngnathus scovelli]|uniref:LOW QUALITY PROTEIN: zinc finger and BTB domain-containing protein 40-like n=1 Tax=Syngnathus scovelli TaxID=161590 RepID=UPI00210FAE1F|nr:LOW QUALITY PROTEIN: zinc finger and BTB domain-containing protein 40-like [Syngnathus scovelli]
MDHLNVLRLEEDSSSPEQINKMLQLPNYSSQLMQQLWALRQEGHFCDCTVLVGDEPHRAHKVVLAASSMLFRSLLNFSDTVSIDTTLVSSQEFTCLLDMSPMNKLQSPNPDVSDASAESGTQVKDELETNAGQDASEIAKEPTGTEESIATATAVEDDDDARASKTTSGLERSSQLTERLALVPDVVQLLSQAANRCLEKLELQLVCECCKEADPRSVVTKLLGEVEKGLVSEQSLLSLLRSAQREAPSSFPASLLSQLEEMDNTQEPDGHQTETSSEMENSSGQNQVRIKSGQSSTEEPGKDEDSSSSKSYRCRWCKKSFSYKCRVTAHMKRCPMSEDCQLQCPQCPAKLLNKRALQRHLSQAHPAAAGDKKKKKKVACDLCGRTFAHPSGMIYHKRTEHYEEKPYACETCGAKFPATSSLKNHMRLHTGEKPYRCKHCDMSFRVAAALAYHTKKKHSEGKMYACQYCKAVFAQSIELTRHVRTHTGDKPYVCRECGKGHSQASGLTVHLQTFHNMSQPLSCQKCSLSFQTLEEHQKHIEELHVNPMHKCPTCRKVFSSAALLDNHKSIHTGVKPYVCNLCNKSYQQLSGLWYHNRTNHPQVIGNQTAQQVKTLVQCDVCSKFFPCVSILAKHIEAEHEDTAASTLHCVHCQVVLAGGAAELQEHNCSRHTKGAAHGVVCPLCTLVSGSQTELQEHLLSCHVEAQQTQVAEEASSAAVAAAHTVITVHQQEGEVPQSANAAEEQQSVSQRVFVAVAGGGEGDAPTEVVEVNMYDLLNNSVTFICEGKPSDI